VQLWVKICGLTTREGVDAAIVAGADAIGFVFAPSKRQVSAAQARELVQGVAPQTMRVAVMLHPTQAALDEVWSVFRPDVLQTDVEDLDRLQLPAELAVMPVLRVGMNPDLHRKEMLISCVGRTSVRQPPLRVLLEGPISGAGQTADWHAAAQLARTTQLVLAGGLNETNVASAIAAVRPFGVDVSSGVEAAPGIKDPVKIHEFVRRARAAANGADR
jgi:phosphoribosylanthranilate isomerase